jgi:hypothetical protein
MQVREFELKLPVEAAPSQSKPGRSGMPQPEPDYLAELGRAARSLATDFHVPARTNQRESVIMKMPPEILFQGVERSEALEAAVQHHAAKLDQYCSVARQSG